MLDCCFHDRYKRNAQQSRPVAGVVLYRARPFEQLVVLSWSSGNRSGMDHAVGAGGRPGFPIDRHSASVPGAWRLPRQDLGIGCCRIICAGSGCLSRVLFSRAPASPTTGGCTATGAARSRFHSARQRRPSGLAFPVALGLSRRRSAKSRVTGLLSWILVTVLLPRVARD